MLAIVLRFALALFLYIGNITNFLSAVIIRAALSLAEVIEHPEEIQILDVDPETLRARHYRLRVLPDPALTPPPVEVPPADPREAAEPSEPAPPRHQYALRPRAPAFVRVVNTTDNTTPASDIRGLESVNTEAQEQQRRIAAIRDAIIKGQEEELRKESNDRQ